MVWFIRVYLRLIVARRRHNIPFVQGNPCLGLGVQLLLFTPFGTLSNGTTFSAADFILPYTTLIFPTKLRLEVEYLLCEGATLFPLGLGETSQRGEKTSHMNSWYLCTIGVIVAVGALLRSSFKIDLERTSALCAANYMEYTVICRR